MPALKIEPLVAGVPHSAQQDYLALPVLITPELAAKWLTENNHENRKLTPARIQEYAGHLHAGTWRNDGNTIAFTLDGRLINGQHRLHAVVMAGVSEWMLVAVNCDPLGFATTDTGRTRSARDVLSVIDPEGKYHTEMGSLARFVINYERDTLESNLKVSHEETVNLFTERGEELRQACEEAGTAYSHVGASKLALSSAYWLIEQHSPGAAKAFYPVWTQALGLTKDDPTWALVRVWRNAPKRTSALERTAWVVKGYNNWVRGEAKSYVAWRRDEKFPTPLRMTDSLTTQNEAPEEAVA